jgi:hypothetical protein
MLCSGGGAENSAGQKFCNPCGAAFKQPGPKCGFDKPPNSKFRGECGAALAPPEGQAPRPPSAADPTMRIPSEGSSGSLEGERKTVTALFADIEGATEIA